MRSGLYPEVDPPESVPNPMDDDELSRQRRRDTDGSKGGDALSDDVLKRARKFFSEVAEDEARRVSRTGRSDSVDGNSDSGGSLDGSESGVLSPEDQASSPSSIPTSMGGGDRGGGWFSFGRRSQSNESEGGNGRDANSRSDVVAEPLVASAAFYGQKEDWPPDEVDVAAAEGIRKDYSSDPSSGTQVQTPIDIQRASRAFWKIGWWTWWIQLVLTTISGVIVLFAFAFPGVNIRSTASATGFVCAGLGVSIAFVSLLWTYGYTRLAIRLRRAQPKWIAKAPENVSAYLRMGIAIALAGMFVSLIGLQAIVGTLLARLFGAGIATTPYTALQTGAVATGSNGAVLGGLGSVQPVDILVVQASANAMSALLAALTSAIWFRGRLLRFWAKRSP